MKLLYVASIANRVDGVTRKILAQFKYLSRIIPDSQLILFISGIVSNELIKQLNSLQSDQIEVIEIEKEKSTFQKLSVRKAKMDILAEKVNTFSDNFVFYFRYPLSDGTFLRLIKIIKKSGGRIVTEHQSIETRELLTKRKFILLFIEKFFGMKVRKETSGFVCVTKEIASYELARSGNNSKPCLVNGNGIDVTTIPMRTIPKFNERNLELLCVSQVAKWHGLDRLIKGIANYSGEMEIKFHIIGEGSEIENLKRLVKNLKLEKSVIFHGFKTGKELDSFFDRCHIAIGSLAIHRAGSGSPLKSREYCARGIPFVDSVNDPDFSPDFPYRLKIDSNESPVDFKKIKNFAKNVLRDKEHPKKMREYAKEKLDWSVKMRKLANFLEKIFNEKEGS